jgi:RNA polymerase sigma-70 factor, ECF subfamily
VNAPDQPQLEGLVAAAARGDESAMHLLLQEYLPRIRAYVRLRTGGALLDHESRSDLVQSICRDLLENARRLHSTDIDGFQAWLFSTAQRKLADRAAQWATQKRDPRREVHVDDGEGDVLGACRGFFTPSQQASAREELTRVEQALGELPEERREVILLAKVLGLSRQEIGARLGRSEGAVRVLLTRALADLALRVSDHGSGD